MAQLRAAIPSGGNPKRAGIGFDGSRNLLVLPSGGRTDLYLVGGADLDPVLDGSAARVAERALDRNEDKSPLLEPWERDMGIRAFTFTGLGIGEATFNSYLKGTRTPWIKPLTVRVTADGDYRQAGDGMKGEPLVSGALRVELAGLTFRDALVRLADDQMNSGIGRDPNAGFGRYGLAERDTNDNKINWCGAFVHWLYKHVANAKHMDNPFTGDVNSLASPQKAIGFALHFPERMEIIGFSGPDPYGWSWPPKRDAQGRGVGDSPALQATLKPLTVGSVMQGDVCLVRENADPATGWKHVDMVLDPPDASGAFTTIDGNQGGSYNPTTSQPNGCIGRVRRNANDVAGGVTKFVFLHVKNLPGDTLY